MPVVPHKDEPKSDFVSRCTAEMIDAGHPQDQAVAACYSMWENSKEWDESQHPRVPAGGPGGGQFGSGGTSGSTGTNGSNGTGGSYLTPDEHAAIAAWEEYQDFEEINYMLRHGQTGKLTADEKKLVADLSSAIDKNKLDVATTLYRGVSAGEDNFGRNPGQALLDKLGKLKVGDRIVDNGFMATSTGTAATDYGPEGTGSGAMMVINAPAGFPALRLTNQGEHVLQRQTAFTLTGVKTVKGFPEYSFSVASGKKDWGTNWRKDWDESQHPRVPAGGPGGGQFSGGGGGGASSGGRGHPGEGYSASARVDAQGTIYTSNVYDAARALAEGRKVELDQPKQVSTLINHLGQVAKNMELLGEKAPVFNLCNVSVRGTNLFCADTLGIPRVEMPQLDADQTKAFIRYLKEEGYTVEKGKEHAANLRATQNELNGVKVANIIKKYESGKQSPTDKRIIISRDDYILDGHHHWAADIGLDAANGTLNDDKKIRISRVDISITKLLEEAEKFTGGAGKKPVNESYHLRDALRAWVEEKDWNEEDHPRDDHGQFTSGGSSSGSELGQTGGEGPVVGNVIDEFEHKYGLNESDQKQLYSWMGSGYRTLRSDDEFGKTLEKLPPYNGRVYRGTRLTDEDLARLQPGAEFKIDKYSSSSLRSGTASIFTESQRHDASKKTNVMFAIDDRGRRIPRDMAQYAGADENEVVLMRGDRYRINKVESGVNEADERPFVLVHMSQIH